MLEPAHELQGGGDAPSTRRISHHDIVTLAAFLMGGVSAPVAAEDVAVEANELAPGRFIWRKYCGQINIATARKRLWNARNLARLNGSGKTGWTLTEEGLCLARSLAAVFQRRPLPERRLNLKEKRWRAAERRRLLASADGRRSRHLGLLSGCGLEPGVLHITVLFGRQAFADDPARHTR